MKVPTDQGVSRKGENNVVWLHFRQGRGKGGLNRDLQADNRDRENRRNPRRVYSYSRVPIIRPIGERKVPVMRRGKKPLQVDNISINWTESGETCTGSRGKRSNFAGRGSGYIMEKEEIG